MSGFWRKLQLPRLRKRAEAEARQTEIGNRVSRVVAEETARKARQA